MQLLEVEAPSRVKTEGDSSPSLLPALALSIGIPLAIQFASFISGNPLNFFFFLISSLSLIVGIAWIFIRHDDMDQERRSEIVKERTRLNNLNKSLDNKARELLSIEEELASRAQLLRQAEKPVQPTKPKQPTPWKPF
jgi:hypothetical protein